MDVRIHQAGQEHFALQVDELSLRAFEFQDFGIGSDAQDFSIFHGHSLLDGKIVIDGDQLPMMQDQIRLCFGVLRATQNK